MKLCTCFSARDSSNFFATTATTKDEVPAPYNQTSIVYCTQKVLYLATVP